MGRQSRPSSPTARRYQLASRLKQLRLDAGRTPDDVARELVCSPAKVTRIENGQRIATPLDLKVLAQFYGLSDVARDELMRLAGDARKRGWWQDLRSLDEQTQTYLGLEEAATAMYNMSVTVVPGLLQTQAYMRSLLPRMRTPDFWPEGRVDQIIEARIRRQRRVADGSLSLRAIVDEGALVRDIGPPGLLTDQLAHLIEMAGLPNVDLQVVTLSVGAYPGLEGSFTVITFEETRGPGDVVFIEHLASNYTLREEDHPETVQQFRDVHAHVRSRVALSPSESGSWLAQRHEDLTTGSRKQSSVV